MNESICSLPIEVFIFLFSFFRLELFAPSTYASLASKEKIRVKGRLKAFSMRALLF